MFLEVAHTQREWLGASQLQWKRRISLHCALDPESSKLVMETLRVPCHKRPRLDSLRPFSAQRVALPHPQIADLRILSVQVLRPLSVCDFGLPRRGQSTPRYVFWTCSFSRSFFASSASAMWPVSST